jgi:hypothetical protein
VSTSQRCEAIFCKEIGGIAQLVERRNGISNLYQDKVLYSLKKLPKALPCLGRVGRVSEIGGLAHLVERYNGIVEVTGSSPVTSTISLLHLPC